MLMPSWWGGWYRRTVKKKELLHIATGFHDNNSVRVFLKSSAINLATYSDFTQSLFSNSDSRAIFMIQIVQAIDGASN